MTSRIVSSPDSSHPSSARRSARLENVIAGYRSASKKSGDRRWSSRIWVPVLTDDTPITAEAADPDGLAPVTIWPLTSLNVPRTRVIR